MAQLLGSVLTVKVSQQLFPGHPSDLSQVLDSVVNSRTRGSLEPKRGWLLLLLLLFTFLPKKLVLVVVVDLSSKCQNNCFLTK